MRRFLWLLPAACVVASTPHALLAITSPLTQRDVDRALAIGAGVDSVRARFHAPYITRVDDPLVEQIEVITEFRRHVLTAEEQLVLGHRMSSYAADPGMKALQAWRGRLSVVARLRLHPQNTFVSLPPYECLLGDPIVAPLDVLRTPIHGTLSGRKGDTFAPLLGARVEAIFESAAVGQARQPVRIALEGREIKRVLIDFGKVE